MQLLCYGKYLSLHDILYSAFPTAGLVYIPQKKYGVLLGANCNEFCRSMFYGQQVRTKQRKRSAGNKRQFEEMTCIGIKVRACLPRGRALSLVVKCSTRTQDMQTTWLSKVLGGQEKHKSHKARCSPCNINHPNGVLFS